MCNWYLCSVRCREYPRQPTEVIVQEIGNATFLEFDGNLVNVDDLAKYRKVFNANSKYMYYINIVSLRRFD